MISSRQAVLYHGRVLGIAKWSVLNWQFCRIGAPIEKALLHSTLISVPGEPKSMAIFLQLRRQCGECEIDQEGLALQGNLSGSAESPALGGGVTANPCIGYPRDDRTQSAVGRPPSSYSRHSICGTAAGELKAIYCHFLPQRPPK